MGRHFRMGSEFLNFFLYIVFSLLLCVFCKLYILFEHWNLPLIVYYFFFFSFHQLILWMSYCTLIPDLLKLRDFFGSLLDVMTTVWMPWWPTIHKNSWSSNISLHWRNINVEINTMAQRKTLGLWYQFYQIFKLPPKTFKLEKGCFRTDIKLDY